MSSRNPRNVPREAIVTVVVVAVLYSELVFGVAHDEIWDWLHTLLATLISVFFAFVVGLTLYNRQTSAAAIDRRQELINLLQRVA